MTILKNCFFFFGLAVATTACGGGANESRGSTESTGGTSGNGGGSSATAGTAGVAGTTGVGTRPCDNNAAANRLRINELSSNNDGNAIDENGATDDWIELVNDSADSLELSNYELAAGNARTALRPGTLAPGERVLLWADDATHASDHSLPFKLSSKGEKVTLFTCGRAIDAVELPALATNDVYSRFPDRTGAFSVCRYATAGRPNGAQCEAALPPNIGVDHEFPPYQWPKPPVSSTLTINELLLRPAGFVELLNLSDQAVSLSDYKLYVAQLHPGVPWPAAGQGVEVALPATQRLLPGEKLVVPLLESDLSAVAARPEFEGVVSLFDTTGSLVERVDFAWVPEGAALARIPEYPGRHVFCSPATPGENNDGCRILERRDIGAYDRHLRTLADFSTLSDGGGELGLASVKFILDMSAGDQVYLPSAKDWSLHYEFVREVINQQPPLNRCNSSERSIFNQGWYDFSVSEYFKPTGRTYLLGTMAHHASTDLYTVEFALGDTIAPADMRKAFFAATAHTLVPARFFLRPQDDEQTARAIEIEGSTPIVPTNAPFIDVKWQPLTAGLGYGILTFATAAELDEASLGPDVIVITDDVPNDMPLVGGLITEAFQTPLSHINVLCQNRGTPNLALPHAHELAPFKELLGQLVKFEVSADGYHVTKATPEEAQAFWDSRYGRKERLVPRLDPNRTGIVSLGNAGLSDLPSIGAKAAQLGELIALQRTYSPNCLGASNFTVPSPAFAVPVHYFVKHFEESGAWALLQALVADSATLADRTKRHTQLALIRNAITNTRVDAAFLSELSTLVREQFGTTTIRLRSSSNAEDLPGFNGAGLYSSTSAELNDPDKTLENALLTVWSSLYLNRAFDERELLHVDHSQVAMAVLIHPAFTDEKANGVIITRDIQDIVRGDIYTFNAQAGEASVTNPAPGVTSDQFIYRLPPRDPPITEHSRSSLSPDGSVLTFAEVESFACAAKAVVSHFRPLVDPEGKDGYFTMDLEFKLLGQSRTLLLKQARPYSFGSWKDPGDCRQF